MKTSREGLSLIQKFEGKRLNAYKCAAGVWTIGYGHTSAAGAPAVKPGMKITDQEANDILVRDLAVFEAGVSKALTRVPTQAQFDAMVSLAFNIGTGAFSKSSVVKHFNAGNIEKAAGAFMLWNKAAGKVLPGLTRRRAEERALFLKPSAPAHDEPVLSIPKPVFPVETPSTVPRRSFWDWLKALFSRGDA